MRPPHVSPSRRLPAALPPTVAAALLEGPRGVVLHLRADDGGLTQMPLTRDALREIAALATAALASPPRLAH